MTSIAYCNPFVPAEWIAAHGLRPRWLSLRSEFGASDASGRRGLCPFAAAVVDAVSAGPEAAAVVLTTTCDQMRYAGSLLEHRGESSLFLLNVPSTWQAIAARTLYAEELERLGRFLVRRGGNVPSVAELARVMTQFDRARTELRQACNCLSAKEFALALWAVRQGEDATAGWQESLGRPAVGRCGGVGRPAPNRRSAPSAPAAPNTGVPLALVGGPVPEQDCEVFDWLEQAGGQIVLDATEWGERTLPRPFDPIRTSREPLAELADAYLQIPDVFRRPNDPFFDYLGRELAARHVRGLIVRRYLWCDLWHAEVARLKMWSPVPVLDLDVAGSEDAAEGRTRGRIEAFLEMLR
jgi:benzoyl-CoA reductase/2-hydroxyglutaryl-CoA dehydratase subunit BcrC/BadD/HgdB